MKLTWFGGTTLRVHMGGRILIVDPDGAPSGIDRHELTGGADLVLRLGDEAVPAADGKRWQPRKAAALVDEATELPDLLVFRLGWGLLVDAVGEPPLVLATGEGATAGRWGRDAVVVTLGAPERLALIAAGALAELGPRLIAVAGPEGAMDAVMAGIASRLDGTGLVSLEPGLALEV